ncbi:MAG: AbrB/MazE/SpoVT family DNA-binding domain-containing protein, partial [Holophagales bacterium]|nr:AbrB/MazE/SpoVT family DNA-binding domain-containing protein [Holophagales bacterium]
TKGQVVIPKEIRDRHQWTAGEELWTEERNDGILLRSAGRPAKKNLSDLLGIAGYTGPRRSLEDMDVAVADAASEQALGSDEFRAPRPTAW